MNCIHYHSVKQEELCILLRVYYTAEELYNLLKGVIGTQMNFKDFVLQNYKKVNYVSELAELANMSLRNFERRFKAEFMMSARKWWNERRAEAILRDILNGGKEISSISIEYGFSSPSYFVTFCKKYFGATPSRLRAGVKAASADKKEDIAEYKAMGGEYRQIQSGISRAAER